MAVQPSDALLQIGDASRAAGVVAERRGHTVQALFYGGGYDLSLAYAPEAELDQVFTATCLETGERLEVRGWLFTVEVADDDDDDGQPDEAAEWADFDPNC